MRETILRAKPSHAAMVAALPILAGAAALLLHIATGAGLAIFKIALAAACGLTVLWIWVIGHAANERVASSERPSPVLFRAALIFATLYITAALTLGLPRLLNLVGGHFALAVGLHILAALSMLKATRFVATNLAMAEKAAGKNENEAWSTTFSLWSLRGLIPVQKRVNELFSEGAPQQG